MDENLTKEKLHGDNPNFQNRPHVTFHVASKPGSEDGLTVETDTGLILALKHWELAAPGV